MGWVWPKIKNLLLRTVMIITLLYFSNFGQTYQSKRLQFWILVNFNFCTFTVLWSFQSYYLFQQYNSVMFTGLIWSSISVILTILCDLFDQIKMTKCSNWNYISLFKTISIRLDCKSMVQALNLESVYWLA